MYFQQGYRHEYAPISLKIVGTAIFTSIYTPLWYRLYPNTTISARGDFLNTGFGGVHGTLNSKNHYVTGMGNFDAEYTYVLIKKTC